MKAFFRLVNYGAFRNQGLRSGLSWGAWFRGSGSVCGCEGSEFSVFRVSEGL